MAEIYPELSIIEVFLVIIASVIMTIVYQKRRDLIFWLITYITLAIGVVISGVADLTNPESIGHLISRIFYVFSSFSLFIGVFKEYHDTFSKDKLTNAKLKSTVIPALVMGFYVILLEAIIIICCAICTIMLIRISLEKKTFTHAFLSISITNVLISLCLTITESFGVEGMTLYCLGMNIIFFTTLLITAIVALLEKKIIDTLSEKNYLKDKYSHDLGNIFHTISMSYELKKSKDSQEIKIEDLDDLIKKKILEALNLVKNIRKL